MRRGRRDAVDLRVGDPVDCWRVDSLEPNRRLRLSAEMKLPGRAWLEFEVEPTDNGSRIRQTAVFDPIGLTGLAYWYTIYPLHEFVFGGMLNGIASTARRSVESTGSQGTETHDDASHQTDRRQSTAIRWQDVRRMAGHPRHRTESRAIGGCFTGVAVVAPRPSSGDGRAAPADALPHGRFVRDLWEF